jgi:hypothetical protein
MQSESTNYGPLLHAAKLPRPTVNKKIKAVLDAEAAELDAIIEKAAANAANTKSKPCTTPSCNISWKSFFRKKIKTKKGGNNKRRSRRRNKTRR